MDPPREDGCDKTRRGHTETRCLLSVSHSSLARGRAAAPTRVVRHSAPEVAFGQQRRVRHPTRLPASLPECAPERTAGVQVHHRPAPQFCSDHRCRPPLSSFERRHRLVSGVFGATTGPDGQTRAASFCVLCPELRRLPSAGRAVPGRALEPPFRTVGGGFRAVRTAVGVPTANVELVD
jgi:hypothetical protein